MMISDVTRKATRICESLFAAGYDSESDRAPDGTATLVLAALAAHLEQSPEATGLLESINAAVGRACHDSPDLRAQLLTELELADATAMSIALPECEPTSGTRPKKQPIQ